MSKGKKDFKGGIKGMLDASSGSQSSSPDKKENTTTKGLKAGNVRHTFTVREDQLEYLRRLAYWDRRNIRELIVEAFEALEEKHGEQKPIPKR